MGRVAQELISKKEQNKGGNYLLKPKKKSKTKRKRKN